MVNANLVFHSLARVAQHRVDDDAIRNFDSFVSNPSATSYIFENKHYETYKLERLNDKFVLGFPERNYSGDPAVVEATNQWLALA